MDIPSTQNSGSLNSSSSSEDLDDLCIDHELVDLDSVVAPKKPHFLDLDAVPPPGFDDYFNSTNNDNKTNDFINNDNGGGAMAGPLLKQTFITKQSILTNSLNSSSRLNCPPGESVKIDKIYERDGEISDYELAASGFTKKELLNDTKLSQQQQKKKHFLDENPIPPDYMIMEKESREHRSLDRNFERLTDSDEMIQQRNERKHSLDRESRSRRVKEPSYTLSRFIESDLLLDSANQSHSTWPATMDKACEMHSTYSSVPNENIQNLGPKVECVYSLLSMLGSHDSVEMSKKFLELSRTPETCATLRRSGCIPLLVQMMHSDSDDTVRKRAAMALHNVVHCHPDDKAGRREAKVLRLIEQIMDYCSFLKTLLQSGGETIADDSDRHPLPAISSLMKVSFDEEHRHAMCQLGALQAIASLVHLDHAAHGPKPEDQCCNSLRRYALMALTNLTFGDGNNKALLCSNKEFMEALVAQLDSAPDDLLQVTASVLRNLSWRADNNMKSVLNEIGTVTALAKAAMKNKNENTLKAILSALWNLSAHCSTNKAEFCAVEGALAFLVDMLSYEGPSKTLKIIENAGGILRNVSSHIAVREDYRKILRQRNCLGILMQQLKSESLTVVSNACGTLWNLSARFPEDQKYLWDNGAVPMLRSLIHSKHKMISEGSSAALKNLLNFRPGILNQHNLDPIAKSMGLKELPTLNARKQKALQNELNPNLTETCENLDIITPPKESKNFVVDNPNILMNNSSNLSQQSRLTRSAIVSKSESKDSIISTKSDSVYEKLRRGKSAPPQSTKKSREYNGNDGTNNFDVQENELPIDYSAKYNENDQQQKSLVNNVTEANDTLKSNDEGNFSSAYQETDLDQLTDFSLRYAENQIESDSEILEKSNQTTDKSNQIIDNNTTNNGNEIILLLEDTVKCYQTEDTPYVISNAASVSDLRNPKPEEVVPVNKPKRFVHNQIRESSNGYVLGSYTPEKPINYCEEGTPGYFSRYESLSSLDESPPQNSINTAIIKNKPQTVTEETLLEHQIDNLQISDETEYQQASNNKMEALPQHVPIQKQETQQITTNNNQMSSTENATNKTVTISAQETPLMFSRRSSMDSLAGEEAEPMTADDKSSVVSDFSRLASGVISPSELPDSPTQSMPQSPRRNVNALTFPNSDHQLNNHQRQTSEPTSGQRLRSVFEDGLSNFQVENTPAQFSCATSLSNLSLDDEPKITTDSLNKEMLLMVNSPNEKVSSGIDKMNELENEVNFTNKRESCGFSDGDDDANNDDFLLATCINIGMNRNGAGSSLKNNNLKKNINNGTNDSVLKYCTEDTPALLSKVGSNSNLSSLSSLGNKGESVNLSDISSNVSDCGSEDFLQQCIRDGMQKSQKIDNQQSNNEVRNSIEDPISMLRRGGSNTGLPSYLPVKDEMNKFVVEDSPCNFSVISGLSNLTVGSELVGPANLRTIGDPPTNYVMSQQFDTANNKRTVADDSLSSISIESEDDSNLLSQAIAAGCNRPKLNISGNTASKTLPQSIPKRQLPTHQHTQSFEPNDSLSSVDSSDSNDNQAKTLFEQCIRTGMNKQLSSSRKFEKRNQSGNSLANTDSVSPKRSQLPTLANQNQRTPLKMDRERQRERDRKDEQLLKECISSGMIKSGMSSANRAAGSGGNENNPATNQNKQQTNRHLQQERFVTGSSQVTSDAVNLTQTQQQQKILIAQQQLQISKNAETTSVAVLEQHLHREQLIILQSAPSTAPGVEMRESPEGTSTEARSPQTMSTQSSTRLTTASPTPPDSLKTTMEPQYVHHQQIEIINSKDRLDQNQKNTIEIIGSKLYTSINLSNDLNMLDQSNEYPAQISKNMDISEEHSSIIDSSYELKFSNEFLIENDSIIVKDFKFDQDNKSIKILQDKHKDPDLMLKSVERLTQELVSTAEYLRTNTSTADTSIGLIESTISNSCDLNTVSEKKSDSASNSNHTWNEDTCPNDVSFPSLSVTAPVLIASMNDDETTISDFNPKLGIYYDEKQTNILAEKTPTNEIQPFEIPGSISQPNSLETETDTLVNDEIDTGNKLSLIESTSSGILFKVGGEVKQPQMTTSKHSRNQFPSIGQQLSFDTSTTSMSNSTIIAMEANKLANNLMNKMTDSTNSLDLDNIRPPSCMDTISLSGGFDSMQNMSNMPQSPQLSRMRKKSLPAGLMARRALGCATSHIPGGNGSVESINSSYNLDMIKPPSLMDELLDSMISVASITSEVVDHSLGNTDYDTALTDTDDMTATLQSCMDGTFPIDGDGDDSSHGTPIPSDFSSVESTPRKGNKSTGCLNISTNSQSYVSATSNLQSQIGGGVKRMLTPKQKRRLIKDRYKTYTVAADFVLKESFSNQQKSDKDYESCLDNHDLNKTFSAYETEKKECDEVLQVEIEEKLTPLQRRIENPSRFQTQIIQSDLSPKKLGEHSQSSVKRRNINPERFKTRTILYSDSENTSNITVNKHSDFESLTSTEDDSEEMSSIRAMTKQFKYINQPIVNTTNEISKQKTSIPIINQFIRMKLLEGDNQRPVSSGNGITTTESDYNSMECDQNSETESCDQNTNHGAIDDEINSPTKKPVPVKTSRVSKTVYSSGTDKDSGTDLNFSEDPMTPPERTGITDAQTSVKSLRGRKKPPYVSPYKKSVLSGSNTRTTSPKSQIAGTVIRANLVNKNATKVFQNKTNIPPIDAKTHVVLSKGNLTNKINALKSGFVRPGLLSVNNNGISLKQSSVTEKKNIINKKSTVQIPTSTINSPENPKAIERQGTFVKDEPSNNEVPIVDSLPTSPIKQSKLPTKAYPGCSSVNANSKPPTVIKSPVKTVYSVNKNRNSITKNSCVTAANQSIGTTINGATDKQRKSFIGVRKSPSVPVVPQRSNSNASLRQIPTSVGVRTNLPLTNPPSRSNSNLTSAKISQIGSRIAGIWKRVEESKKSANNLNKQVCSKPSLASTTSHIEKVTAFNQSSTIENSPQVMNSNVLRKSIASTVRQKFKN